MNTHLRQLITLLGVVFIASTGQAEETISHRSPDKKFAVRLTDDKAELIALPSRKKVLEFDPLPASGIVAVTWTPDSRRFAAGEDEESAEHGRPGDFRTVEVFERTGATFRKVGLPDLRYPEADWPKGMSRKTGGEYISALRWLDANTLVLNRTTSSRYGPNVEKLWRLTAEITLVFDKEGRPTVASVKEGKEEQL